jgi:hypothetical protein
MREIKSPKEYRIMRFRERLAACELARADFVAPTDEVRALLDEAGRLRAERDKLIAACVAETWRGPDHGWEWRLRAMGDFERTREDAVAAVRRAAGLGPEG